MSQPDFAHASDELVSTPWPAHLAGAVAALAGLTAWVLLVFVAADYLTPYAEQGVVLGRPAQVVLGLSKGLQGFAGYGGLALLLGGVHTMWQLARSRGGVFTFALFVAAGVLAVAAIVVALACGAPADDALGR